MAKPDRRHRAQRQAGASGNFKEATVLIPLTYNDGTEVPRETLLGIMDEIFLAFRGWADEGTIKGAYRMRSGAKRVEELQRIVIVLDESQMPQLEAMVGRWGALLGQETMLLKIADPVVKFVPPMA
jgi:hypothetical protein